MQCECGATLLAQVMQARGAVAVQRVVREPAMVEERAVCRDCGRSWYAVRLGAMLDAIPSAPPPARTGSRAAPATRTASAPKRKAGRP